MEKFEWLIVGLGNPENKYLNNRHNIGWSVITDIVEKENLEVFEKTKYYISFKYSKFGTNTLLAIPLTYMNLSGEAVQRLSIKYGFKPSKIIVLVDEYNFPVGKVHIKSGGGDGGHNGITSIIEELNNNNFLRLRLGISKNFGPGELVDYVLADFPESEREDLINMKQKAIDSINHILKAGFARAASDINSEILWKPKEETKIKNDDTIPNKV